QEWDSHSGKSWLEMTWNRIVDSACNAVCFEPLPDVIAMVALKNRQMCVATGAGCNLHRFQSPPGEEGIVPCCNLPSLCIPGVQPLKLYREECSLQPIEPMVATNAFMTEMIVG